MSNSPQPQYYEEAYALQQYTKELHSEIRRLYDQNSQLRKTNASLYEAYIGVIGEINEICSDPEIPVLRNSFPPILPPPFLRSSGTNQEYIKILKEIISDLYSKNEEIYLQNETLDKARRDAQQILEICSRKQQALQMSQESFQSTQGEEDSQDSVRSSQEEGYNLNSPNSSEEGSQSDIYGFDNTLRAQREMDAEYAKYAMLQREAAEKKKDEQLPGELGDYSGEASLFMNPGYVDFTGRAENPYPYGLRATMPEYGSQTKFKESTSFTFV